MRRARTFATSLLILVTVMYLITLRFEHIHPAFGYVAAFSEAAMIGALADWFAVVALFRYPMGVPIPHTAIIPRNKNRIADNLGTFIETHFLQPEQLLARIDAFDPARRLSIWLARPGAKRELTEQAAHFLNFVLGTLDDPRFANIARDLVLKAMSNADFAGSAATLIQVLREDGRHQQVLDGVLRVLLTKLEDPKTQSWLSGLLAKEFDVLRWVALDEAGGRYLARKLVTAAMLELDHALVQPDHMLRHAFDDQLRQLAADLGKDPALRSKVDSWRDMLIASPLLHDKLDGLWRTVLDGLQSDLTSENSQIRSRVGAAIKQLGLRLHEDQAFAEWLNQQIRDFAARSIIRYRSEIGRFIADQFKAWDNRVLVARLELNVGVDLQFIRVNGTLVGGAVGVLIYSVRHAVGF
ncbi:membrane protein [Silvimonas amylolytica]|uniref:Membrane protein n=1 Tax=Silvimonas amylolytica TaxID=449663 RepID=A0ABQ2PLG4_9NEIS|nr:membrane protein [Silvimonas amylolytica]